MNLYVINHGFHYELENVARLFFPNEKITAVHCVGCNKSTRYLAVRILFSGLWARVVFPVVVLPNGGRLVSKGNIRWIESV